MKNEVSIEKLINEETKRRLDLMEEKDYEFPERFFKDGLSLGRNLCRS